MSHWQLDFKDASNVPTDPDGKRQHVVEVPSSVNEGTSVLVEAQVEVDFHAETTLEAMPELGVASWAAGSGRHGPRCALCQ